MMYRASADDVRKACRESYMPITAAIAILGGRQLEMEALHGTGGVTKFLRLLEANALRALRPDAAAACK